MGRDRSRDRHKDRDRYFSERERERDRSRDRDRYRDSDRHESSRRHERRDHRDRDRHKPSRDRSRSRERDRDRHRERSSKADDSSRKHRHGGSEAAAAQQQQQQEQQQPELQRPQEQPQQQQQHAQADGMTEEQREAAIQKKREAEQSALDAEMEERRKRVEEWRKKRAAEAAAAELERKQQEEAAAAAEAAAANKKVWSLEDDEDDEEQQPQDGQDEVDPLDAFMAGNAAAVTAAPNASESAEAAEKLQQGGDTEMADAADEEATAVKAEAAAEDDDDVDPLDAFMAAQVMPEVTKVRWSEPVAVKQEGAADDVAAAAAPAAAGGAGNGKAGSRPATPSGSSKRPGASAKGRRSQVHRYYDSDSSEEFDDSEDEASEEDVELDDETWAKNVTAGKLSKGEKLAQVDHAAMEYLPFRRNFYIEVPEIKRMSEEEVAALRKTEGIKVRGQDIPRPVKTWNQCGINIKVLEVLKRSGFERPLSIQAQALPIIMSGRDCIGIAKTGSGKTLAFVLPMLRHIRDQPELRDGDGPIALIMAPTRELVQQIAKEVKRLGGPMLLSCTPVFGGAGVASQISELKRGTEVVAATPGRLIDLLVNKVTNLRRVTYLVLDEADRMFDMGFEPQITRIINNTRPDRQTVMFSATFPRAVETLARQILDNPVEIQVGGRSVVNNDIAQFVEIRPDADRFLRLLEILGEWYEAGKIIIFVHSQDKCDNLFRDLLKAGYPCLSLHGGKEQSDRECTITDFKGAVCNILVATSVAARGLDVRELVLVVNYDVPNHHEDYVHRVGRTGRAGNKGTAITFIGPDEERYAPDLVKALKESGAPVPQDLQELADGFNLKRKHGLVQGHGSGYGGSGFKFDKDEDAKVKAARKSKAKEFGMVEEDEEGDKSEEDDDIRPSTQGAAAATALAVPNGAVATQPGVAAAAAAAAAGAAAVAAGGTSAPKFMPAQPGHQFPGQAIAQAPSALVAAALAAAAQVQGGTQPAAAPATAAHAQAAAMRAAALAAAYAQGGGPPAAAPAAAAAAPAAQQQQPTGFESELVINDFPQNARWKVTHKGFQQEITDLTGAAVTTKGIYVPPGQNPPEGERKLYLLIEAPTEAKVRHAKQEIRRVIEDLVERAMRRDVGAAGSRRYNI